MPDPVYPARSIPKTILWAGALVGTFDLTSACIYVGISSGGTPAAIGKYIASAIVGPEAFAGGTGMVIAGFLLHYLIAYIWTTFFFIVYPKLTLLRTNWLLTAVIYGLFIWTMMNRVVVPLSNTPKGPFNLQSAVINALILIVAIGIPLSLIARKTFIKSA